MSPAILLLFCFSRFNSSFFASDAGHLHHPESRQVQARRNKTHLREALGEQDLA